MLLISPLILPQREAHKTALKQSALSSANQGGPTFQQQSALSSANQGSPTFQQLTHKQKTKTGTGLVATEVSTPPGSKAPRSPDSHCDDSMNKVEFTSLTVEEESGLELKPGGMGVGHISVSVSHHDSSDARGDIMQHARAPDGGDKHSHKTAGMYQNMTVENTEQAKERSCSHVFLTATLDSEAPKEAEPKATEQQTNIRSEETKLEREPGPHTNNQEPAVTQSSVQVSREGESISQETESTGCSGGEQTVESSMFGIIGVSVQNTQSPPSANTAGQSATPRTHKK